MVRAKKIGARTGNLGMLAFCILMTPVFLCNLSCAESKKIFCVRAGAAGANDGSDWKNAFTNLPPNLVRGAVYYVAEGKYDANKFDAPDSGTTKIFIKKATPGDHGTDNEWSPAYAKGPADFEQWDIQCNYLEIDGQVGKWAPDWPGYVPFGFRIRHTETDKSWHGINVGGNLTPKSHLAIRHVDVSFTDQSMWKGNHGFYCWGGSDIILQYCWFHHYGQNGVYFASGSNTTVDHCMLEECGVAQAKKNYNPPLHSEVVVYYDNLSDAVFSFNVVRKFRSTGGLLLGGGNKNIHIFGNIFTLGSPEFDGGGNGVLNSFGSYREGKQITGCKIYNNTFVDIPSGGNIATLGTWGSDLEIKNNLFYSVKLRGPQPLSIIRTPGKSNNWYYDVGPGSQNEPGAVTGTGDPFANRAGRDYRLARPLGSFEVLKGKGFDIDMAGQKRGADGVWDPGAFEYVQKGPSPSADVTGGPAPPAKPHSTTK